MKQKILRAIEIGWVERVRFAKYFIVGITTVALDVALLVVFVEWLKLTPTLSVVLNQVITLGFNFLLHKYWSFGSRGPSHRELVRYLILAVWDYVFSVYAMHLGNEVLGLPYLFVRLASIACMMLWNFVLMRIWVYRADQKDP